MKKEFRTNRRYSAEFKIRVISDMRNNHLGYHETVYKYWDVNNSVEAHNYAGTLRLWERIYLEEGEEGFMEEKRGRSKSGQVGKIAANILNRDFESQKSFGKPVTDVTEFSVCNEKVYLSPVMDLFNNEIVAHSISLCPSFVQTKTMLERLFKRLPVDAKPLLHYDQGWQYQMREYQMMLKEHNITQSMSRKGNCLDNSVMENFSDD